MEMFVFGKSTESNAWQIKVCLLHVHTSKPAFSLNPGFDHTPDVYMEQRNLVTVLPVHVIETPTSAKLQFLCQQSDLSSSLWSQFVVWLADHFCATTLNTAL